MTTADKGPVYAGVAEKEESMTAAEAPYAEVGSMVTKSKVLMDNNGLLYAGGAKLD